MPQVLMEVTLYFLQLLALVEAAAEVVLVDLHYRQEMVDLAAELHKQVLQVKKVQVLLIKVIGAVLMLAIQTLAKAVVALVQLEATQHKTMLALVELA
jgi:hypothetical protein